MDLHSTGKAKPGVGTVRQSGVLCGFGPGFPARSYFRRTMKIQIHATGSKGNAYTIIDDDQRILIDPGISFKKLMQACKFKLAIYDFCLVSHEHKDHSKAIPDLLRLGKNCYMSQGTRDALGLMHSGALIAADGISFERSGWRVLPFATQHDAAEPLGFLIQTPSGKKIVFATDTYYIKYKFSGVTHWMIEANYSEAYLKENTALADSVKRRIRESHFEIENVKAFFGAQDLSSTQAIYLIHLSEDNSDAEQFKKEVEAVIGVPVTVP